ncbi:MAG TPA: MMPL family transporter [Conexibacter sp.]|nr:MMPL family transporter [Conexibacter sp.]
MTPSTTSPRPRGHRNPGAIGRLVRSAARIAERRPKTIVGLWLAFVIACIAGGSLAGTHSLTNLQSEVGESAHADARVAAAGLRQPAVESVLVRSADAARTQAAALALAARARALPQARAVHGPSDTPGLTREHGRVALVQATLRGDFDRAADRVEPLLRTVAAVQRAHPGTTLQEAGPGSGDRAGTQLVEHDLQRSELLSIPITLVVLGLAFGALAAAAVPLLLGITSVAAALGALGLVSQLAPASESTGPLVVLIGLAVGVDYSLFYIRREREERRRGAASATAALDATAATVGRAILVSGITVAIALAGLLITGLADFVSMGAGTIVVVLVAMLGSLTVLPAVLALMGDRVDRGRIPGYRALQRRRTRREAAAGRRLGPWAALSRAVTRRPAAALVVAVCVLGALAVPAFQMRTQNLGASDLPHDLPVARALRAIERSFPGAPDDAQLVVRGSKLGTPTARTALDVLGRRALDVTHGSGSVSPAVARDGRTALLAVPLPDRGIDAGKRTIAALRTQIAPQATHVPGAQGRALVTGGVAADADFSHRLAVATPEVIAFVLALGFLLLLAAFRSLKLAAGVMALNLLSIGAAYGVLVAVFQHTWAEHALGFQSNGHIVSWLPLLAFVVLFGLSMDYTVLVLERMREARLAGRPPREAAAEGVAATAGAVTSAAVVMVAVFAIFATLSLISFKELGIGLSAAVLVDATIVRGVALPALVALLSEHGWRVRAPRTRRARPSRRWDDAAVTTVPDGEGA